MDELTFFKRKGLVPLIHAPQPEAGGLVGLGHLVHGLLGVTVMRMPLPLVDEAPVPGLVGVDVAVVHESDEVPGGALLPRGQARHFLT